MKKTIFALALVLGTFFGVSQVYAQSLYQYQYAGSYAVPGTSVCTNLSQDLSFGSRGSQVTQLQAFLADRNYPGGGSWMVTGYFGSATRAAVRNFQQEQGLPQTGMLDAVTRAAVYQVSCSGAYTSNYYQTQYPYLYTSQQSYPYNYNYNYNTYPYVYNSNNYPYNYGCNVNYAYNNTGWYQYNNCGNGNVYSNGPVSILYLNPNSGAVGNTVTVFGNGFSSTGNTVHFGIGIISNLNSADGRSVSFIVPTQLTGYGSQIVTLGTYNVSVTNAGGYTSGVLPFTVTSLGTAGTPSITNVSGPTSINAGTSGVWTLQAYNPGSNYLSVHVTWGDENTYGYATTQQAVQTIYTQGAQTLTFSHVYTTAGTYTITFTATNANGASSVASATVYVSGSTTTGSAPVISYLSPTYGPVNSTVTIYGTNFSQWGNTIRFGNGAITNVSSNGTTITFTVPTYLSPYCTSGTACPLYAQVVTPGVYPVSVINGTGITSNVMTFTVQ